jgi:hypothetical protein
MNDMHAVLRDARTNPPPGSVVFDLLISAKPMVEQQLIEKEYDAMTATSRLGF